ncbi:GDP-mannose 4,6-dehydratase [bacterium]|nr:GDP-mannose 4,6-dehydratase [bacterium]
MNEIRFEKPILITGGTGFAGRHLITALQKSDCSIHTIDCTRIAAPGENWQKNKVTNHLIDLTHPEGLLDLIKKIRPREIYHLAGRANVKHSWHGEGDTYRVNVIGAVNLMTAIRDADLDTDVLIISSGEVYGLVTKNEQPITESRLPVPRSPYAASKYCQEIACSQIARTLKGKVVIVRPFNHIGPGQRLGFVTADFANQIAQIEKGLQKPVIRVGNLEAQRDFTDVRDTVNGYIHALHSGQSGDIINVCSSRSYKIMEFLKYFLNQSTIDIEVEVNSDCFRPADIPLLQGSHQYLTDISGWQPETDIFETLLQILNYWRGQAFAAELNSE